MKPILFNTDMVRALLEGRKTVTRRVVKPQHAEDMEGNLHGFSAVEDGNRFVWKDRPNIKTVINAPYRPGDILYVRETWNKVKLSSESDWHYEYRASCENPAFFSTGFMAEWRPSIHMPKAAARLFLRVTGVWAEHLWRIDSADALAEGMRSDYPGTTIGVVNSFAELWDSTIKPADLPICGWTANPWVWVIEFERISKEETLKGGESE